MPFSTLASVAAAFFYLRVVVLMFMREPQGEQDEDPSLMPRVALVILAGATILLGVLPGLITGLLRDASVLRW